MLYTTHEIAAITDGLIIADDCSNTALNEISTDSRTMPTTPGSTLFVALVGPNRDGHSYLMDIYNRGVRHFMVSRPEAASALAHDATIIAVPDTMEALRAMAADNRARYHGPLLAITGSNGKTTVKEWIAQLWPPQLRGALLRSPRSYNSQLGVALSLLMIRGDEQLVVIEAGISTPGEMSRLEQIIAPTIGMITNIGDAHSENFENPTHKLDEKMLLFSRCNTIIYNDADRLVTDRVKTLGDGRYVAAHSEHGSSVTDQNIALVHALYRTIGVTPLAVNHLEPIAMRLEMLEGIQGSTILNDSYSNDPVSLGLALDLLSHTATGAKSLILSDIPSGSIPDAELYATVARMLQRHDIEHFVGVGPALMAHRALFGAGSLFFDTTEALLRDGQAQSVIRGEGAFVLIKGARTFGFERVSRIFEKRTHTTTLEVNLSAMADNLRYHRNMLAPGVRMMVMVKAYSYGTGSVEIAAMLQHQGVDFLAVAFADEGVALRGGGVTMPIVVLNSDPGSFSVMTDYNLEPEIYSPASLAGYIQTLSRRGITHAPIHLKLDTGMHRLGFQESDLDELTRTLRGSDSVVVRSIFSHLAASEDPAEDEFTRGQIALFDRMSRRIIESLPDGSPTVLRHICNSAGIERFPEAHFDMVRLGIGLYGTESAALRTVATLKTQIVQIKSLAEGDTVGYGRRGTVHGPMRTATIPIGYADGMDRHLGCGRYAVEVAGRLCPTVGNICMDTTMIDITGLEGVHEGDTVTIFGERPTAQDMARVLSTISYEVITSISQRIRRIFISE